jgi:fucose permease
MKSSSPESRSADPVNESSSISSSNIVARTAGGAITGALIGLIADPFTAVIGAAACAVLGAADGFKTGGEDQ